MIPTSEAVAARYGISDGGGLNTVACENCDTETAVYADKNRAIVAWNTRAPDQLVRDSEWISVEDELPENAKTVSTARVRENGLRTVIGMGFYRGDKWQTLNINADTDITHWQPLPSPPSTKAAKGGEG
jgi:hypothetical protein